MWRKPVVSALPMVVATIYLTVPVDFVFVSTSILRAIYLLSAATLLLAILLAFRSLGSCSSWIVLFLICLAVLPLASAGREGGIGGMYICLPVIVGILIAQNFTPRLAVLLLSLAAIVLLTESLTGVHWYSAMFGEFRFPSYASTGNFRARGVIGQPVPAAFLSVAISGACIYYFSKRREWIWVVVCACAWMVSLVSTGTRSALMVSFIFVGLILLAFRSAVYRHILAVTLGITLFAWFLVTVSLNLRWAAASRLFEYGSLAESESGRVRSNGFAVVRSLPDACGFSCEIFGHGGRSLEQALIDNPAQYGLSTVDNQFVSVYWDFGAIGVVSILALFCVASFTLTRGGHPLEEFGAAILVITIISGIFFDAIYTRPLGVTLGVGIGLMVMHRNSAPMGAAKSSRRAFH
ncbi:hypothetical protein ACPXCG_14385 [Gordonia sp. DT218]|uniref:hypothetical protein n=1 Tax=Gordonia sp. DT218 TaxID=3416659 RepID=UPI003CF0CE3C